MTKKVLILVGVSLVACSLLSFAVGYIGGETACAVHLSQQVVESVDEMKTGRMK